MVTHLLQQSDRSSPREINPFVSVIIDNYNYGQFLRQAIDSVLAQTYKNFELIVVDDGSTDNSREIIESYADRLIAIFQANAGQEAAFTTGIEQARGEIICFLDSDDYFHPDKVAKVVASFVQHPEWVQIGHCWTSINAAGVPIGKSTSNVLSQGNVRNLLLSWGKYASGITSGLSCRRSALQNAMPFRPGWGIDAYLNVTLPFYGEVGCINEPLMFYRMHGKNIRAYNDDLSYLIQQREATAAFINEVAAKMNLAQRFDLKSDVDYRSYKAMAQGGVGKIEALQIIWLSLQESWAIGRSLKDTAIRLLYRTICTLFPQQGILILRYGLRGYVRWKFLSQAPKR